MAHPTGAEFVERAPHIQQIQMMQQQRNITSPDPYPLYDFQKPEQLHPTDPGYQPPGVTPGFQNTATAVAGYDTGNAYSTAGNAYSASGQANSYPAYDLQGQASAYPRYDIVIPGAGGGSASDPPQPHNKEFFVSQRTGGAHASAGGAGGAYVGDSYTSADTDNTYRVGGRGGSITDDDKMHGTGGQLQRAGSDVEAERGLEMLRAMHERVEASRRVGDGEDLRLNLGRSAHSGYPNSTVQAVYGGVVDDAGCGAPTNHPYGGLLYSTENAEYGRHITDEHYRSADKTRYINPMQSPVRKDNRLSPSSSETNYALSRKPYHHPLQASSEPAYSRNASPGGLSDVHRSQSQQGQLRLVYDSTNSGRNSSVDDPAVSFDRYARRASRARVLGKAEELLNNRRNNQLDMIRETSGRTSSTRQKKSKSGKRKQQHQQRRMPPTIKIAFMGEEVVEEEETRPDTGRHFEEALASFRHGVPGQVTSSSPDRSRRNRLKGVNSRAKKKEEFLNQPKAPHRWGAQRKRPGGQSLSDYDQYSSGSEEDIVRYNGLGYDDLSRFERPRPQAPGMGSDRTESEQNHKKARRVWFFRNGDADFKAKLVLVSPKTYPTFETLLVGLGEKEVPTVAGVRHIFSWPEGKEIKSVTDLQNGRYYVCASVNRLIRVNYGNSREQFWHGGKMHHLENHLFVHKNGTATSPPNNQPKPHVITVISNMYRDSHEKLILNPNTTQNFEDVLADIQNMVTVPHPPVKALYTEATPHIKVEGFSHLFRDLREHKNFLVCGEEGVPIEPKKRPLPSSNSSSDSVGGKGSYRTSKHARADVAGLSSDSVSPGRRPMALKRIEPVRCDVNGKKREFFAPSVPFLDNDGSKPEKKLKLEWVYGFRGRDVKQNLVLLPNTGELVYFVAAVIVLYDRKTHTQKHYTSHTEEVTCLALHPRYPYIASGQVAGNSPEGAAHVRVWDAIKLSTYAVIGIGVFQQGISCLSFSESDTNGDLLLAIDDSDRHEMTVWEWTREDLDEPSAKTTTTNDPVVYGCFYPFDDKILITFGKQHMYFWSVFWNKANGRILRDKKSGLFEDELPKFVTSVCFAANRDVITGDSTGSILVWSPDDDDIFRIDRQASASMKFAHKKNVSSLVMLSVGVLLSGGGSEIKAWDSLNRFKLLKERVLPDVYGTIRKIVPMTTTGVDGYLFVGTAKDVILEGSLQSKFRPVVQGHSEELWAVKAHPTEPSFFTAGHDCSLIKWSADDHNVIWATRDKKPCTSIAVDPLGQLVAVGTSSGRVTLYGCGDGDGRERSSFQVGQAQVNAMSFSPDGSQIAIGCYDGFVHIYVIHEDGQIFRQQSAALRHSGTFVMHLDWSSDSRFIQTVLGDYDLIFWDVQNMQRLKTGRTLRDVNWATYSCPVGYPLIGAWQALEKNEVINVACRSKFLDHILTGDSRGRLRLYKYPSTQPKADHRQVKPFSSNTTAAEFLSDDTGILASGGNDAALMHYALTDR
ncbi:echinoderm microtubule-associated protein-like CG42247 isoform X1 [Littorina saxatilis]|uniref:Doublecortin domain-containing protein n=1 Tax=Littorina saxatilis TaxID=31220 RepID=A0AAN9AW78_9CAEN